MDAIREFFIWLWTLDGVKLILAHIALNFVIAIVAAVRTSDFKPHKLAEFLYRKLLPYLVAYGAAKTLGSEAGFQWLAPATLAIIETTLLADLTENLNRLGIPMPEIIKRYASKRPPRQRGRKRGNDKSQRPEKYSR